MHDDTLDLEVQRVTTNALQTVTPNRAITHGPQWALARLSDEEFEQVMVMAKKGRERIQTAQRALMRPGVHYYDFGQVGDAGGPGNRPKGARQSLSKAGAEVLRQMFRLVAVVHSDIVYGDGRTTPQITVNSRATVHMDNADGAVVGTGEGACTSWERKYRYRRGDRTCPSCGVTGSIIKGKEQYGGGWICWKKKGGCDAKWKDGAPEIEKQVVGDIENPDQYDLLNTIVKMAEKRAKVDATIDATASSDLFTQDVEDMPGMNLQDGDAGDELGGDPDAWRSGAPPVTAPPPAATPARGRSAAPAPAPAKPAAAPAPAPAQQASSGPAKTDMEGAKRRFSAALEKCCRWGWLNGIYYAATDAGRAKRVELLQQIFRSDVVDPAVMSSGEWGIAAAALERWATMDPGTTLADAVDASVAASQQGAA